MRNNETGEFELVVGNKQLLSGFFIVVLLFAVAFAMGYVVGQNTQRPAKMAENGGTLTNSAADSRPQPASPLTPTLPPPAPAATDPAAAQAASSEAGSAPQPTTQPAVAPASAAQPASQPAVQPAQAATPAVEKPAAAGPASPVGASELAPGSYWQVIAVKPEVAEAIRQTLKNQGFQVTLTPGPNNLTRVLVGPYPDAASFGLAKTKLETTGGYHPVRARRD
jgi:cytoskeletal protein RodZ